MRKFFLILSFVLALGFLFCVIAFGQNPAGPVVLEPVKVIEIVRFDFSEITDWFTDVLKRHYLNLLAVFVVWLGFAYIVGILEGKMDRIKVHIKRRERLEQQGILKKERLGSERQNRQRELERSGIAASLETEYRSRDLQNIVLDDNESLANVDGTYYVRSASYEVVPDDAGGDERSSIWRTFEEGREYYALGRKIGMELTPYFGPIGRSVYVTYKTLEQWRLDKEKSDDELLAFDNEDYGRVYESIVEKDYHGRVANEYREHIVGKVEPEEYRLASEPLPYDDSEHEWSKVDHELEDLSEEEIREKFEQKVKDYLEEEARGKGYQSHRAYVNTVLDKRGQLSYGMEDLDDFDREYRFRERQKLGF